MLEQDIRETYRRMAETVPPPAHVSIPAAGRAGRARHRRRRVTMVAAPVLAAAAVLAVAIATASTPPFRPRPVPAHEYGPGGVNAGWSAPPPDDFNALIPFATFNRAAAGWQVTGASDGNSVSLQATSPAARQLTWMAYARGACKLTGSEFHCLGARMRLTGPAPDVTGHQAYWGYFELPPPGPINLIVAYQYAPGSWAMVQFVGLGDRSAALMMARNVVLHQKDHLRFAAQLTGLPAGRVLESAFVRAKTGLLASSFTEYYSWGSLQVHAEPPSLEWGAGSCGGTLTEIFQSSGKTTSVQSTEQMIGGHRVYVATERNLGLQSLCAVTDNLLINLQLEYRPGTSPPVNVADIFAHHLRLLGADPADWTTKPFG